MNNLKLEAAQILENAGLVLSLPEWWNQGFYAEDSQGLSVTPLSKRACKFCMIGAVFGQQGETLRDAYRLAFNFIHAYKRRIPTFNDTPGRTNTEVASLLLDAADELRRQA